MLKILYEDQHILVTVKPAGVESQAARKFGKDMVSEIRKYLVINKKSTPGVEPYVGVIHRLDKPVSGIMVYGLTKNAAAKLSAQVQNHEMEKIYEAVVCGKPGKTVDNYVDYLEKSVDGNYSQVVEKGTSGAKRAELSYECLETIDAEEGPLSLLRIHLKTGRHHQIRVQMAAHGLPLYGDFKYNPEVHNHPAENSPAPNSQRENSQSINSQAVNSQPANSQSVSGPAKTPAAFRPSESSLALCACRLAFRHPATGKPMAFSMVPSGGIFEKFSQKE